MNLRVEDSLLIGHVFCGHVVVVVQGTASEGKCCWALSLEVFNCFFEFLAIMTKVDVGSVDNDISVKVFV